MKTLRNLILILTLIAALFLGLIIAGFFWVAGNPREYPVPNHQLSLKAQELITQAFLGIENNWIDYHAHLIGYGEKNAYIGDGIMSFYHPKNYIRFKGFQLATKVKDLNNTKQQYFAYLNRLLANFPHSGKMCLYAFDKAYLTNGEISHDLTSFYVGNDYLIESINSEDYDFFAAASVNPLRIDAIEELEQLKAKGVRFIKLIPNVMGFNPADPKLKDYYKKIKELDFYIITHVGLEMAVPSTYAQEYNNPLLWRNALDLGTKVIMAHAASFGNCIDLDSQNNKNNNIKTSCFNLWLRLMDEPKYQANLYADISAITVANRKPDVLKTLLQRQDLHPRLVNGSDYPVPNINGAIWTYKLKKDGFITSDEKKALNEIYKNNPLLFDFVLKRTMKDPATGAKFSSKIFTKIL